MITCSRHYDILAKTHSRMTKAIGMDKFCSKNGLFCLPAVLVKSAYSAQNCSDTLILLEFCSVSEKSFGPLGRLYFRKCRGQPGHNP